MLLRGLDPLDPNSVPLFAANMTEGTGLAFSKCFLMYKIGMVVNMKVKGGDICKALGTGLSIQ